MAKICGIDEAGRGALAGELVVAGCVFKPKFKKEIIKLGLSDSKKINRTKKRGNFFKFRKNERLFSSLF